MLFNGQITYGDFFAIVIVSGIVLVIIVCGVALALLLIARKK